MAIGRVSGRGPLATTLNSPTLNIATRCNRRVAGELRSCKYCFGTWWQHLVQIAVGSVMSRPFSRMRSEACMVHDSELFPEHWLASVPCFPILKIMLLKLLDCTRSRDFREKALAADWWRR